MKVGYGSGSASKMKSHFELLRGESEFTKGGGGVTFKAEKRAGMGNQL